MRRFLVAAGMSAIVMLAPAAPAMAGSASATQPHTRPVAVAYQHSERQPSAVNKPSTSGKGKHGLWGLLGLLGLIGLAGMRKAKTQHREAGIGDRSEPRR